MRNYYETDILLVWHSIILNTTFPTSILLHTASPWTKLLEKPSTMMEFRLIMSGSQAAIALRRICAFPGFCCAQAQTRRATNACSSVAHFPRLPRNSFGVPFSKLHIDADGLLLCGTVQPPIPVFRTLTIFVNFYIQCEGTGWFQKRIVLFGEYHSGGIIVLDGGE